MLCDAWVPIVFGGMLGYIVVDLVWKVMSLVYARTR